MASEHQSDIVELPDNLTTQQRLQMMRVAENVIKSEPGNVEAHLNIAALLGDEGRHRDALIHLKKALSLRKKDISILKKLADASLAVRDLKKARMYVRKILEITPRDVQAMFLNADALLEMGEPRQAVKALQRILEKHPKNIAALEKLAKAHRNCGDAEGADNANKALIAVDPTHPQAIYYHAHNHTFSADEASQYVPVIEKALLDVKEDDKARDIALSNLRYSYGKIMQDVSRYDEAFDQFRQANDLRNQGDDPRLFVQTFTDTKRIFGASFFSKRTGYGSPSDEPIFIVGMPRSGTTLTESLVAAHSKVSPGDEMDYMDLLNRDFGIGSVDIETSRKNVESVDKDAALEKAGEYLQSARAVVGSRTHYFTDKLPHNFIRLGFVQLLFPNAKIIHVRRHPIDNAVSLYTNSMMAHHNAYKTDLKTLGLYLIQYIQIMRHWREVLPGGFHEVFYEDLVANTELNARKMLDYIGLEWEDQVMARQTSQKSVRTLSAWQVRQPVYTSSTGRWKVYEKHLGPLLDMLGGDIAGYEAELAALADGGK